MSERGKIRCDECVYAELMYENTGLYQCHRWPPHNQADWPRVNAEDWCGEFKRPEIVEKETAAAEQVIRGNACNHIYPEIGCSKCMKLLVEVDKDGILHLRVDCPVRHSYALSRCFGMGCIACLSDAGLLPDTGYKRTSCLCNGVGCNSCEPGGRG